jgi:hypothetical protein
MDTISNILMQREARYGTFSFVARAAQEIKQCIFLCIRSNRNDFMSDQIESLDMIASKIARIVNGDPNYIDNWDDIAGYAKLVADRLRQQESNDASSA